MGRFTVFLLLAILVFAGCEGATAPVYLGPNDPQQLKDKRWQLVGYTTFQGGYSDIIIGDYSFKLDSIGFAACSNDGQSLNGRCELTPAKFKIDSLEPQTDDYLSSLTDWVSYKQRDSVLLVIPQQGKYMHLFFRAR